MKQRVIIALALAVASGLAGCWGGFDCGGCGPGLSEHVPGRYVSSNGDAVEIDAADPSLVHYRFADGTTRELRIASHDTRTDRFGLECGARPAGYAYRRVLVGSTSTHVHIDVEALKGATIANVIEASAMQGSEVLVVSAVIEPDAKRLGIDFDSKAIRGGLSVAFEYRLRAPDGPVIVDRLELQLGRLQDEPWQVDGLDCR